MKKALLLIFLLPAVALAQQPERLAAELGWTYDTSLKSYRLVDSIAYKYSTGGGDPFVVTPHTYDTATTIYFYSGGTVAMPTIRTVQTFSGNNIVQYLENWDNGSQSWIPVSKTETKYDTSANLLFKHSAKWENNQWADVRGDSHVYDVNNNRVFSKTWFYNVTTTFSADSVTTYTYYSGKVLDSSFEFRYFKSIPGWDTSAIVWGTHISSTQSSYLDLRKFIGTWDTPQRRLQDFDTNRRLLYEQPENYHSGVWSQSYRYYYAYDANGNKTRDSIMTTPPSPPNPLNYRNSSKSEYSYNSFNQLTEKTYYLWDTSAQQWAPVNRRQYQYRDSTLGVSSLSLQSAQFILYPNPAGTELYIDGATGNAYFIYSADGRQLSGGVNTGVVPVGELSPGNYFIVLDDGRKAAFVKL